MTISDRTLAAALCGFLIALLLTKGIQAMAVKYRLLDSPNERSSHIVPVPRIGGLAIAIATIVACAISVQALDRQIIGIAMGSILLAATGLWDDLRPLRARQKYIPQVLAAVFVAILLQPEFTVELPYLTERVNGFPAVVVAVVWITATTNAFNFMDGIDGLVAGVAIIIALVLSVMIGDITSIILLPFAASLAGYLAWNMHPANIFMGDVGSQFIGFLIGAAIVMSPQKAVNAVPIIVLFTPFLFDTGFTILRRLRTGENVFSAHRTHLYQRLTVAGIGHRSVSNLYYGATSFAAMIAIVYSRTSSSVQIALIMGGVLLLIAYAVIVMKLEQRTVVRQRWNTDSTRTWD